MSRLHRTVLGVTTLLLGLLPSLAGAADGAANPEAPWPAPVPGWKPVEPGEHPRLFFRKSDLPEMKRRAETPEGKAIVARLKVLLGGGEAMPTVFNGSGKAYAGNSAVKKGDDEKPEAKGSKELPVGAFTLWHGAGFGMLYQLTGEKKYADLGRQCVEKAFEGVRDRDDRYSWVVPGGALRAGPSIGAIGMAYDLCYDGWDEAFRSKVALEIQNYNQGQFMSLEQLALGKRHHPGSNHWGPQVGGAALCLLAIRGDPGVDAKKIDGLLEANAKCMIRNLTEGFGDHGWYAEGDGPGVISSDTAFVPALQAWRVAGCKDFITPRTNAQWLTLKWLMGTVAPGGNAGYPKRGGYPHNVWARNGMSGSGTFAQGFGAIDDQYKPALLAMYNQIYRDADAAAGTPADTTSPYPHRAVLALVNWPIGVEPKDPAGVMPKAVHDKFGGVCMFRNRWKDKDDILLTTMLRDTKGLGSVRGGPVYLWALGRKLEVGSFKGNTTLFRATVSGGVVGTSAASLGADFSGSAGCEAVLVAVGLNLNVKADANFKTQTAELGGKTLTILTISSAGKHPDIKPAGGTVALGGQTISLRDGQVQFSKEFDEHPRP